MLLLYRLLFASPICAQLPRSLERCLPYPTLAQEIQDMRAEVEFKTRVAHPKIVINDVRFDSSPHLSAAVREHLIASLKLREFDDDTRWVYDLEMTNFRGAWQDQGYFNVKVSVKPKLLRRDSAGIHVSLAVHAEEALQYKLGKIELRYAGTPDPGADLPAPDELRKLIPLRDGEILNAEKIRQGLEEIRKLFGSKGYIDFTPEPLFDVNNAKRSISLVVELDTQQQYRVGDVRIFGLNPKLESILRSKLKQGEPFNNQPVWEFYEEYKSVLPPNPSFDAQLFRDMKNGTISMIFDFRTCAQIEALASRPDPKHF